MSKLLLDGDLPPNHKDWTRPGDWDNPRPTERRITFQSANQNDYDILREAFVNLVMDLRVESRDSEDHLIITHLIPKTAEVSYSKALQVLLKTPPVRHPSVTKS